MARQDRKYQFDARDDCFRHLVNGHSPLLASPTGAGKSTMATMTVEKVQAQLPKWRGAFLVHRRELMRQASERLTDSGIEHGLIRAGDGPIMASQLWVASIDTLGARLSGRRADEIETWLSRLNWAIVDEAHHSAAGRWSNLLRRVRRKMALTATPYRLDGLGLGDFFDREVRTPWIKDLVKMNHLVPMKVFCPEATVQLVGIKKRGGDFATNEIQDLMDTPFWNQQAVRAYARWAPGVPALAFCTGVEHARNVAAAFRAAGWRAASVDGTTDDDERDALIAGLGNDELDVLCSAELIGEGLDCPAVGCIIGLRPTDSTQRFCQHNGRAMRLFEDRQYAVLIDIAGNTDRHGMPDEERPWKLVGGVKGMEKIVHATRRCPECRCVHRLAPRCENCGSWYGPKPMSRSTPVARKIGIYTEDELKRMPVHMLERAVSMMRAFDGAAVEHLLGKRAGWAQDLRIALRKKFG